MTFLVEEVCVNRTENYIFGETEPYKPYTTDLGELFKDFRKEYGRCISKIYIGEPPNQIHIGWVFIKRMKYEDCDETYMREVWVTFHEKKPEVERRCFMLDLGKYRKNLRKKC